MTIVHKLFGFCRSTRWTVSNAALFNSPKRLLSMTSRCFSNIDVSVANGVRTITFNRPEKRNAINLPMANAFAHALNESNGDDGTNVVVLTGTGEFYTSGYDVSVLKGATEGRQFAETTRLSVIDFVSAFINCKKPVIALLNGPVVGIGVTTLGLCDTVLASDKVTFSTPFSKLGVVVEGCASYTLPRIMGYSKANEMLLFGEIISAEEAAKSGLVTRVYPFSIFQAEAWKYINSMAQLPLKSLVAAKELVRGPEREVLHKVCNDECDRLLERWLSDDLQEAVAQFFSRKASSSSKES